MNRINEQRNERSSSSSETPPRRTVAATSSRRDLLNEFDKNAAATGDKETTHCTIAERVKKRRQNKGKDDLSGSGEFSIHNMITEQLEKTLKKVLGQKSGKRSYLDVGSGSDESDEEKLGAAKRMRITSNSSS